MKNKFNYCLILAIMLASQNLFAQLYPVSLDERIEKATTIVSGDVTAQKSYYDDKGDIYTANLVSVNQLLKGDAEETIVVTTKGGQVGDVHTEWSHSLWLHPSQRGVFFLMPSTIKPIKEADYDFQNYSTYADQQGFVKIASTPDTKVILGSDPFNTYTDVRKQVFDKIRVQTGVSPVSIGGRAEVIGSGVRYRFANFTMNGNTAQFDIFVNSLVGSKKLFQSGIVLGYNPVVFGNNLGTNGNLQLNESGISAQPPYNLVQFNLPNNKVALSMQTAGPTTTLSAITNNEQLLAKGSLTFLNPTADPQIVVDIAQLYAMNKWLDTGSGQYLPFDTVIVEGDFFAPLVTPIITSFTPTSVSAGTKTQIEITGMNFEAYVPYVSSVYFTDANAGPTGMFTTLEGDIEFWSPTLIRVNVPGLGKMTPTSSISLDFNAGTGPIQVCNGSGICGTSTAPLTVRFAVANRYTMPGELPKESSFPVSLIGPNDQHGFQISYGATFAADPDAVACAERALNTWKCATGLNYTTDPAHPNSSASYSGEISYAALGPGNLAQVGRTAIRCKDNDSGLYVQGYLQFFVFLVNNTTTWYKNESEAGIVGTGAYDMQSVLLHEFGHTHLLNHVNQTTDAMWFDTGVEDLVRKLKPNDIEGGDWVMNLSFAILTGTDCPELSLYMADADVTGIPCSTLVSTKSIVIEGVPVEVYPNPFEGVINLKFGETDGTAAFALSVVDLTGKTWWVSSTPILNGEEQQIDLSNMPAGIYFLNVSSKDGRHTATKIIKY